MHLGVLVLLEVQHILVVLELVEVVVVVVEEEVVVVEVVVEEVVEEEVVAYMLEVDMGQPVVGACMLEVGKEQLVVVPASEHRLGA